MLMAAPIGPPQATRDDPRVEKYVQRFHPLHHPETAGFLAELNEGTRADIVEPIVDALRKVAGLALPILDGLIAVREAITANGGEVDARSQFGLLWWDFYSPIHDGLWPFFAVVKNSHPRHVATMDRVFPGLEDYPVEIALGCLDSQMVDAIFEDAGFDVERSTRPIKVIATN